MGRINVAKLILRIGLITVLMYAAVSSIVAPTDWVGYLPPFAIKIIPALTLLKIFTLYEIALSIWLASGKYSRYAAILVALTMAGIILTDLKLIAITFRDIAIATGAIALAILSD